MNQIFISFFFSEPMLLPCINALRQYSVEEIMPLQKTFAQFEFIVTAHAIGLTEAMRLGKLDNR